MPCHTGIRSQGTTTRRASASRAATRAETRVAAPPSLPSLLGGHTPCPGPPVTSVSRRGHAPRPAVRPARARLAAARLLACAHHDRRPRHDLCHVPCDPRSLLLSGCRPDLSCCNRCRVDRLSLAWRATAKVGGHIPGQLWGMFRRVAQQLLSSGKPPAKQGVQGMHRAEAFLLGLRVQRGIAGGAGHWCCPTSLGAAMALSAAACADRARILLHIARPQ